MARRYIEDPLAPTPEKRMRRQIRGDVNAQMAPLIADITRRINASAKGASQNIAGTTSALAQQLMPMQGQVTGAYDRSINQLQGLDKGLADRLASLGSGMGIGNVGAGAAAAATGTGNAQLSALLMQRAAGEQYAGALPGLARMQGAQDIGRVRAESQKALADQLGEARTQAGSLIASLTGDARRRELEKAVALRGFGIDQAELISEAQRYAAQEATRRATLAQKRRENARKAAQKDRELTREETEEQHKHELELKKEAGRTSRQKSKETATATQKAKDRRQKARIEGRRQRQRRAEQGKSRLLPKKKKKG